MKKIRGSESAVIEPEICLLGGLLLLLLPLPWIIAWVTAAIIHELGHFLAIRLCGGDVYSFRIGLGGAVLEVSGLSRGKEALCSLAGPAAGLLALLAFRQFPRVAVCALLQSGYNLLPVFPLDGGRALQNLMASFLTPETTAAISRTISGGTILLTLGLALLAAVRLGLGLLPLLLPLTLLLRRLQ